MPTQQQIYARRRLLALLAILVVSIVIWIGTSGILGGAPQAEPKATASESSSVSAAPTEIANCAPGVVQVEVMIGNETETLNTFASGSLPNIWYAITNTGLEDCKLNVGARVTFFTITSGDQTYWSSRDCDRSQDTDSFITLISNKTVEAPRGIWDRVYSSETGCGADDGNASVPAGGATYKIKAEVNGVISEEKAFILN
ncbi:MAG: hypothetical protein RL418_86 [Actinomycetota bacterium]